jgi:hypothetical protein
MNMWWNWEDGGGSICGLFQSTNLAVALMSNEIWTGNLLNMKQEYQPLYCDVYFPTIQANWSLKFWSIRYL